MRSTSDMVPEELPVPMELPIGPEAIPCTEALPAGFSCGAAWEPLPIPPMLSILLPLEAGGVTALPVMGVTVEAGGLGDPGSERVKRPVMRRPKCHAWPTSNSVKPGTICFMK